MGSQAGVKVRRAVCDSQSCPGKYINYIIKPKNKTVQTCDVCDDVRLLFIVNSEM